MGDMCARLFVIISAHALLASCVTVHPYTGTPDINSKSQVELTPILITSGLNDIVILSAPIVNAKGIYYLYKPNGDAVQLNYKENNTHAPESDNGSEVNNVGENYIDIDPKNFRIFNVNYNASCNDTTDVFAAEESKMKSHDFMIGPLQEDDHGNWVLSSYYKDLNGDWMELFQVITIEIIEIVPLSSMMPRLNLGETFVLSFAYPLSDLQSCEIVPSKSTFDRFYARNTANSNKCEFIMTNVTVSDHGTWTIIGVGRIVYKGSAFLRISVVDK